MPEFIKNELKSDLDLDSDVDLDSDDKELMAKLKKFHSDSEEISIKMLYLQL